MAWDTEAHGTSREKIKSSMEGEMRVWLCLSAIRLTLFDKPQLFSQLLIEASANWSVLFCCLGFSRTIGKLNCRKLVFHEYFLFYFITVYVNTKLKQV